MESLHVWVPADEAELVEDLLWGLGVAGIETRDVVPGPLELVSAPAEELDPADFWRDVEAAVDGRWRWERRAYDARAANDAWRPHAAATTVGDVTIWPIWVPRPASPIVVAFEPGDGWGHGAHPSTVLAGELVQWTLDAMSVSSRVLDVGCGSGVLSMLAAQRGASVTAVDIDPLAVAATAANATRNDWSDRVDARTLESFDAGSVAGEDDFALVVANVGVWVLDEIDEWIAAHVGPGRRVVLSGLLTDQIDRVRGRPAWAGWTEAERRHDDPWSAIALDRPTT